MTTNGGRKLREREKTTLDAGAADGILLVATVAQVRVTMESLPILVTS